MAGAAARLNSDDFQRPIASLRSPPAGNIPDREASLAHRPLAADAFPNGKLGDAAQASTINRSPCPGSLVLGKVTASDGAQAPIGRRAPMLRPGTDPAPPGAGTQGQAAGEPSGLVFVIGLALVIGLVCVDSTGLDT